MIPHNDYALAQDGCTSKMGNTLRQRKQCRYFCTDQSGHRGGDCEYLHVSAQKLKEKRQSFEWHRKKTLES